MALNKLLACASSARAADIFAIPTVAATAKTVAHVFASLMAFLTVCGIYSSPIWSGADRVGGHVYTIPLQVATPRISPSTITPIGIQLVARLNLQFKSRH